MHFIFGNYGNNTIALLQWIKDNNLNPVTVVNVDTGWGAASWQERVMQGQELAKRYEFAVITLTPSHKFEDLVRDRHSFPNMKYQWCPTFLKALPFLTWLDEVDPTCEGIIVLGSRRVDFKTRQNLPEFIEESEHYNQRTVWYPLFQYSTELRDQLIKQAGFAVLNHRSLECNPCIHSLLTDFNFLEPEKIQQIGILEQEINQTMFHSRYSNIPIAKLCLENEYNHKSGEDIDMGCGSFYACGE